MAFDVSKFLALTVLLAGTGAACSGEDGGEPDGGGGTAAAGAPDKGGDAGASDKGGAGNGNAGESPVGGEGGAVVGGAATEGGSAGIGGGSEGGGGAGGAGGESPAAPCLSNALLAGEGGAGAVEVDPSLEGLCMDFFNLACPGLEDYAPAYTVCEGAKQLGLTITATTVADCLSALSEEDQCSAAKATACFDDLIGKACVSPDSAAPCTAMRTTCTDSPPSAAACEQVVDLLNPATIGDVTDCMDPAAEGWWDELFEGDCSERLIVCARRPFF